MVVAYARKIGATLEEIFKYIGMNVKGQDKLTHQSTFKRIAWSDGFAFKGFSACTTYYQITSKYIE